MLNPPAHSFSPTPPPIKQLAGPQQQFVEGRHTEMVICVRVGEQQHQEPQPPAAKSKRMPNAQGSSSGSGGYNGS